MTDHFFVVGAQRSGTTYLYRALDEHPRIAMARPVRPEPKFFVDNEKYERGIDWYESTFFPHAGSADLRGEKSAGYLESDVAAARIEAAFPDARIVAILRNPVERAASHYRFSVENGLELLDIATALTIEEEGRARRDGAWFVVGDRRIAADPFIYRRRGRYIEDLRRYRDRFGRAQMHILVFEDAVGSADALTRLYRFLGVDDEFLPAMLDTVINPATREPTGRIPGELHRSLEEEFEPFNRALADEFELDLSSWAPHQ